MTAPSRQHAAHPRDGARTVAAPDTPAGSARFEKALRYLDRKVSRAIREFALLADGDRILVAVSGGKDSLVLLHTLARRREWRPERYGLVACHVQGGLCGDACDQAGRLADLCDRLDVPLRVVRQERTAKATEDGRPGRRLSPCFVCSWNRRKALFLAAEAEGCSRVALGHHKDDIAETLLLNLLWQGRTDSMRPRQSMFGGRLTIIRPLALVDERAVARVARLGDLPAHTCPCPYAETSKRETAAGIIRTVRAAGCRGVTDNLLRTALAVEREDGRD